MEEKEQLHPFESLEENHQGRNAQRIRIYLGIKQEVFAQELGLSQPQVSVIEQQAVIEEPLLEKIARVLGVTPDLIKKFDVARAIYNINHFKDSTVHSSNSGNITATTYQQINPLDKIVELYERLLNSEREKLELLINRKDEPKN
ncbi:MAG: helix-turn-helix domain-containing protein [Mangrovibacterium sp.]